MSKWSDFYSSRMESETYLEYFSKKYSIFLQYLRYNMRFKKRVAELGCGTSLVTKLVWQPNIKFSVGDIDQDMLNLSKKQLGTLPVTISKCNLLKPLLGSFDLIYSHGVLEHFSNRQLRIIVSNQLEQCNHLIHYVPSNKYLHPSFGDERLMTPNDWKRIVHPDRVISFNNGYDLILEWHP